MELTNYFPLCLSKGFGGEWTQISEHVWEDKEDKSTAVFISDIGDFYKFTIHQYSAVEEEYIQYFAYLEKTSGNWDYSDRSGELDDSPSDN